MSSKISKTQKKIIEAAARLLSESKGEGVRMTDIAKESGVSRQAVYLHFPSRGELMIAAVKFLDEVYGLDERLIRFRGSQSGVEMLETFVDFWGNYIPKIYGVAKALMAAREIDEAAAAAWADRMDSVRSGCRETIKTIVLDGMLSPVWGEDAAVDLMWTMLSIENWERLTIRCRWPIKQYVRRIQTALKQILVQEP